ncbi:DeoR/GlpR family DNA-binding transcription regulator [Microbacterium keratanolyticum]|uniref:DeoR/GlpR family DNA-binding transcription regulator n=1 Tax=Microbacterium keratanolyticum TaxID=67574 RepID=UPI00363A99D4
MDRMRSADERRRHIVELTEQRAYLRPADIAVELSVSTETVRRDLLALEQSGMLRRVHGGALAAVMRTSEPDRTSRQTSERAQKEAIGRLVDGLLTDGDIVFFDVGTTVETAAAMIRPSFVGTVITNSVAVGAALNDRAEIELHVLGGMLRLGELTTYGPDTLAQLAGFNASVAFIGSGGISVERGVTDYSLDDIAIKKMMIERSARSYVLATANKFGMQAKRVVCDFDQVDGVITDQELDAESVNAYREAGLTLLTPAEVEAAS